MKITNPRTVASVKCKSQNLGRGWNFSAYSSQLGNYVQKSETSEVNNANPMSTVRVIHRAIMSGYDAIERRLS